MRYAGILVAMLCSSFAFAQTSEPVTQADPTAAIAALRQELIDSFTQGDVDRLLSHLDHDVVVTWQNGEVCRGPEQVRAYYDKMMTGPDRIVQAIQANPQVTDRHVYGDWAVSWGEMNDDFLLTDGSSFKFNSKFTATIARRGDVWKITSFHVSGNLFDNEILHYAVKRTAIWSAIVAGALGLIVGVLAAWALRRKANR